MFGRKLKAPVEQAAERRQVRRGNSTPAFSYYTSRLSGTPPDSRQPTRRAQAEGSPDKPKAHSTTSHMWLAKLPFWIFLIVVIVCAVKVLALSNDPKVIIVGENQESSAYMQPASVYEAAAQKILVGSVANRSKITVNPTSVSKALQREFPELMDVSMTIPLVSNRPVLYVQPATPNLILRSLGGDYALNSDGVVLTRVRSLPSNIPQVVDQSGIIPHLSGQALSGDTVSFINTIAYQFTASHLSLSTFVLPSGASYEVDARLEGKPYTIRFNLEEDARTQSGAAIATIQQLGGKVPSNYIDVRVPGRVYYK